MYRTDTGHDFSLYFAYELLMILEVRNIFEQFKLLLLRFRISQHM